MKAEIKDFWSPDIPEGYGHLPSDPQDCWVVIQANIGLVGSEAADIFTFYVSTSSFIEKMLLKDSFVYRRGLILTSSFSWDNVSNALDSIVAQANGSDWNSIASELAKYSEYEFENYN